MNQQKFAIRNFILSAFIGTCLVIFSGCRKNTFYPSSVAPPSLSILHSFAIGADGTGPHGDVVVSGTTLYGVTYMSGAGGCLLYTSPSPRDRQKSRMPSSA